MLALVGLFVVYGFIELGKLFHYDASRLDVLEKIDFGFVVATVVIAGLHFLGKLLWGDKSNSSAGKGRTTGK